MSSYVVSDRTINNILTHLQLSEHRDYFEQSFKDAGLCGNSILSTNHFFNKPQAIGAAMRAMNVEAVKQRYDDPDDLLPSTPYRFRTELVTPMQALKSIDCYLYQCAEGTVPEMSLYRWLDSVRISIMKSIIRKLPEYDTATWG